MYDYVTIGGATRDIFVKTSAGRIIENDGDPSVKEYIAFEYGAKVIPEEVHFAFGGGGVNSAVCFARFGHKAAAIVNLGKDETSKALVYDLEHEGVDESLVSYCGTCRTATSIIISTLSGERTIFAYRGANDSLRIENWEWLKRTKWLYVTSLTGDSDKILADLVKHLPDTKTKLAWNPGSVQIAKGVRRLEKNLKQTEILVLNRDEATELACSESKKCRTKIYNDGFDVKELAQILAKRGPKIVLITDGKDGAYAYDGKDTYYMPIFRIKTEDATGAGDAFGSTFIAAYNIYNGDIAKSLKMAAANSSFVIRRIGAHINLQTKSSLEEFIERYPQIKARKV